MQATRTAVPLMQLVDAGRKIPIMSEAFASIAKRVKLIVYSTVGTAWPWGTDSDTRSKARQVLVKMIQKQNKASFRRGQLACVGIPNSEIGRIVACRSQPPSIWTPR